MTRLGRRALSAFPAALLTPARSQALPPGGGLDAAWATLGPATQGWSPLVTPGFPAIWPPDGEGALRRYAFALRHRPGLADGVEVSSPWAITEERPGLPARIVLPGQAVTPLGIQGVRPMAGEEQALATREAEIDALLAAPSRALPGPGAAALVRAFHCGWQRRQGVIAAAVLPGHRAFAGWLGCA